MHLILMNATSKKRNPFSHAPKPQGRKSTTKNQAVPHRQRPRVALVDYWPENVDVAKSRAAFRTLHKKEVEVMMDAVVGCRVSCLMQATVFQTPRRTLYPPVI